jgi:flagellar biosynthesis protein FlhB
MRHVICKFKLIKNCSLKEVLESAAHLYHKLILFMSQDSDPEERTEMPTDRRMGELRKEGLIFHSTEIPQVLTMLAGYYLLKIFWDSIYNDMLYVLKRSFILIENAKDIFTSEQLREGFIGLLLLLGPDISLFVLIVAAVAVLSVMLQTNWNIKQKKIHFKFDFLNPIQGAKRIFSSSGLLTTGKAVVKLTVMLFIGYLILKSFSESLISLPFLGIGQVFAYTGKGLDKIFWNCMYMLIPLALFDYFYGKHKWLKSNKMTKDEVKDEKKSVEGDEATKRKIIFKGLQRIAQRIAFTVPKADVVITNPTHFAVALKYERATMKAPVVVAKGQDFLALKIREIAKESGVPVLERKALARALYASTEPGSEIPFELFRAVAEVLAFVYRLKRSGAASQQQRSDT